MRLTIGIIGSGHVGGTLGTRWARAGHAVTFGARQPDIVQIRELVAQSRGNACAATLADAARRSEVLLLATPWEATREALAGLGDLTGKILVDAVNPLLPDWRGLALGTTTSAAEQIATWAPGARVVKAFNTVGSNIMANALLSGTAANLFYCGDDAAANQTVHTLASELGFDPIDAGPLTQARLLEPLAMLWISLAMQPGHGREIAFRLLRREPAAIDISRLPGNNARGGV